MSGCEWAGVSAVWTAVQGLTLRHEHLCPVIVLEAPQRPRGPRSTGSNAAMFPSTCPAEVTPEPSSALNLVADLTVKRRKLLAVFTEVWGSKFSHSL